MYRLSFLLLLLSPLSAHGVCGIQATVCAEYEHSSIIFRGRVLEVILPPPQQPKEVTYPDGSKSKVMTAYPEGQMVQVRLEVLEVFKGEAEHEITVLGSDQRFRKGGEFLIFASPYRTAELIASSCSRTRPVTDPSTADDLAWLRAYPTASPTASIFGKVTMGYGVTDIPPISIKLSGEKSLTASTAEDHSYAFKDLPPGAYTVAAVLPVGYTTLASGTTTFSVQAKGCAEVDWAIRHDTHIRGTVTDTAGNL